MDSRLRAFRTRLRGNDKRGDNTVIPAKAGIQYESTQY
jgi:hypothetical protein